MASQASRSPKAGTGAFHQSGCRPRSSSRKATRRGQSGQSRGASASGTGLSATHRERLGGAGWRRQAMRSLWARTGAAATARRPRRCAPRWRRWTGSAPSPTIRATPALGPAGRAFANAVAIVESELDARRIARRAEGDGARLRPPRRPPLGAARARSRHHPLVGAAPGAAPARSSPTPNIAAAPSCSSRSPSSPPSGATRSPAPRVRHLLARLTAPRPRA